MTRLLLLLCLVSSLTISAQDNVPLIIDLGDIEVDKKEAIPFSTIQVLDVRFDKSNIGSVDETVSVNKKKLHKVPSAFPDSLHIYLPAVFNHLVELNRESKDTLVLLIKQFRMVDHMMDVVQRQSEPKLLAKISASFFRLKDNQLSRLFSVDDLIIKKWNGERHLNKDRLPEFRKDALASILQSFFIKMNWQAQGASFPVQTVKESIEKRFQLPLYNESALVTGVYKTFKEFKNNQPSITNVSFIKKKSAVEVIDATGKKLDLSSYWGVCYDKKRYIVFRDELSELVPSDKSFRFLSSSQPSDLAGRASLGESAQQSRALANLIVYKTPPALPIMSSKNKISRHFLYLNMDEEEVYLEEVFGRSNLKQMQKDLLK